MSDRRIVDFVMVELDDAFARIGTEPLPSSKVSVMISAGWQPYYGPVAGKYGHSQAMVRYEPSANEELKVQFRKLHPDVQAAIIESQLEAARHKIVEEEKPFLPSWMQL